MAVVTVAFEDLDTWLQNQPANTVDTPYELNITGLTIDDVVTENPYQRTPLSNVLIQNSTKYIDLSNTVLPNLTSLQSSFSGCVTLIKAPAIPSSVRNINYTFFSCRNLVEQPLIPSAVTDMYNSFTSCWALTKITNLPDSVNDISYAFSGCSGLKSIEVSLFNIAPQTYSNVFNGCSNLKTFICDCPYELKQWLTTIHSASTDNFPNVPANCTFNLFSTPAEIPFSLLNNELSALSENTAQTPYEINLTGLTANDVISSLSQGSLGYVLNNNPNKYVDLGSTNLPNNISRLNETFYVCKSLVVAPNIPNGGTINNMENCFIGCTSLISVPNIPEGVIYLTTCFSQCESLETAPAIPNSVTNMDSCFYGCIALLTPPVIPNGVINLNGCFSRCKKLRSMPEIPSSVRYMNNTFYGCNALSTCEPYIPEGVLEICGCFSSCKLIEKVAYIPSTVADIRSCFEFCSALEEISMFKADLATLVANDKAVWCFDACTSLTKIVTDESTPAEATDWHVYRLNFDSNSVSGKVFDKDGTTHNITQTSITKSTLKLPILTDELWFPTGYSDADIETIIGKMIQYKYGVFNRDVIPPDKKSFVLQCQDPNEVISNLPFVKTSDIVDTVASGNMHSVTSNAVAKILDVVNFGGYLGSLWQGEMITSTYPPRLPSGIIKNYDVYNAGGPYTYGQLISFGGIGATQIFLGWNATQTEVGQDIEMLAFMRSWRDNQNGWTAWKRFAFI